MKYLLHRSLSLLYRSRVPEAHNSIRILKEECFKKQGICILSRSIKKFERLVKMRSLHWPVQYLCESWPFRQLDLKLKKPVLIPRFQSQYMITILIERINQKYGKQQINRLQFVEYGCGTGALGLSLVKELGMKGVLIDIKSYCIQLTRRNAIKNKLNDKFLALIQDDMMDHLQLALTADIIISNPPYLSNTHYSKKLNRQIKRYEDKDALVTDKQGLKYIEALSKIWLKRTRKGIMMIQFDGRVFDGQFAWIEPFVIKDQYEKRRFILFQK